MTPKQQLFIAEYLVDKNATQAATRAGYSPKTAEQLGYQLLQKPSIRAAVDAALAKTTEKLEISREWILGRLKENAERALQAIPVRDAAGAPTGEYRYEGTVANKALELLGKHAGLFVEKVDHTVSGEVIVRFARETNKRTAS